MKIKSTIFLSLLLVAIKLNSTIINKTALVSPEGDKTVTLFGDLHFGASKDQDIAQTKAIIEKAGQSEGIIFAEKCSTLSSDKAIYESFECKDTTGLYKTLIDKISNNSYATNLIELENAAKSNSYIHAIDPRDSIKNMFDILTMIFISISINELNKEEQPAETTQMLASISSFIQSLDIEKKLLISKIIGMPEEFVLEAFPKYIMERSPIFLKKTGLINLPEYLTQKTFEILEENGHINLSKDLIQKIDEITANLEKHGKPALNHFCKLGELKDFLTQTEEISTTKLTVIIDKLKTNSTQLEDLLQVADMSFKVYSLLYMLTSPAHNLFDCLFLNNILNSEKNNVYIVAGLMHTKNIESALIEIGYIKKHEVGSLIKMEEMLTTSLLPTDDKAMSDVLISLAETKVTLLQDPVNFLSILETMLEKNSPISKLTENALSAEEIMQDEPILLASV